MGASNFHMPRGTVKHDQDTDTDLGKASPCPSLTTLLSPYMALARGNSERQPNPPCFPSSSHALMRERGTEEV